MIECDYVSVLNGITICRGGVDYETSYFYLDG
jgi:hypothetical protein